MELFDSIILQNIILWDFIWRDFWFIYPMRLGNLYQPCHIIWIFWMAKILPKKAKNWAWNQWTLVVFWGCQNLKWMRMVSRMQLLSNSIGNYFQIYHSKVTFFKIVMRHFRFIIHNSLVLNLRYEHKKENGA